MKYNRRLVTVVLITAAGLLLTLQGARIGASLAASLTSERPSASQAPSAPFQRVQTFTLEATPGNIMSDTYPVHVEEVFYNWPAPPIGVLRLPPDAWDRSGSTPSGPLTALDYSTVVTPGAQSWVKVSYRTRQRATRSGNIVTLASTASLSQTFVQQITSTVVFTRQYPSPPPSEPHKYDDYWGFTTPRVLSIDPAPAQPAQPSQQNWARWFTTTDWFHFDVVFQEPLLGSNLTITKFLVDPPQLRLRHANYFTITLTNIGPVTASRWFYNELYIRAISDSAPTGPYDHVWGLIKFQGDALFRKPEDNDYQIHSLGPSESITMYTVITVTGIMTGNTSYKAYAQTDTAYQGDVYHYYWFGANAEGNGIPPYPEEKNVATLLNTLYISATYLLEAPEIVTQTASPGFSTIHSVPVNNVGNMSDTYTITRVYHGWITSVPSPFGPVNNAAVKNLPVTVAIPAGTPLGAMDTATVTITSRGDPSQSAQVIVRTIAGRYYLPIVMKK